jgi:hypothetical protein
MLFVRGTSVGGTEQVRHLLQQANSRLDKVILKRESQESAGIPPAREDYRYTKRPWNCWIWRV